MDRYFIEMYTQKPRTGSSSYPSMVQRPFSSIMRASSSVSTVQPWSESCPSAPAIPTRVPQCRLSLHTSHTTPRVAGLAPELSMGVPCNPSDAVLANLLLASQASSTVGAVERPAAASRSVVSLVCTPPFPVHSVGRFLIQTRYSCDLTLPRGPSSSCAGPLARLIRGGF
jgi:hypothetical protein